MSKFVFTKEFKSNKYQPSKVENLLLNMSAGLLPQHLQKDEVELLEERFGKDWFHELGYYEPTYRRPRFNTRKNK